MDELKTAYEFCLLNKFKILDDLSAFGGDEHYMVKLISFKTFTNIIIDNGVRIKENSTPRKPEKFLELRMYGLVPYNISDKQKMIQFGHANDDYKKLYSDDENYQDFINQWMTYIVLDGGTSNEGTLITHGFKGVFYVGTMQKHLTNLIDNGIKVSTFYEPDLNSMLSSINFLVDERVFLKEIYPDFKSHPYPWSHKGMKYTPTSLELEQWNEINDKNYSAWVEKIGGPKNAFLRDFLRDKRLA